MSVGAPTRVTSTRPIARADGGESGDAHETVATEEMTREATVRVTTVTSGIGTPSKDSSEEARVRRSVDVPSSTAPASYGPSPFCQHSHPVGAKPWHMQHSFLFVEPGCAQYPDARPWNWQYARQSPPPTQPVQPGGAVAGVKPSDGSHMVLGTLAMSPRAIAPDVCPDAGCGVLIHFSSPMLPAAYSLHCPLDASKSHARHQPAGGHTHRDSKWWLEG